MAERNTLAIASADELLLGKTRRDFLRIMAVGGAAVLLPSALAGCDDDDNGTGPGRGAGTGQTVTIDFSRGDVAVLQFAFALEQLEADFYTRVVQNFSGGTFSTDERTVLTDIRNHEVIHRDFLKAALGTTNGGFALTPTYGSLNFTNRANVLQTARTFEDLGVAAYNGAAQYLTDVNNLLVAGKIVSVEARHASAIRDLINPRSGDFAPKAFDDAFRPQTVRQAAQPFLVDRLAFANAPTTFAQGPNGNR